MARYRLCLSFMADALIRTIGPTAALILLLLQWTVDRR